MKKMRLIIIIGLGFFFLISKPSTIQGAGNSLYTDDEAHFSVAIPASVQKISQSWLRTSPIDPKHREWCKDALEEYGTTFIGWDGLNQTDKSLIILGIKTYKHEKKRFKVFTDYVTVNEFFDSKVIKEFRDLMKKGLIKKGAKNVIVEDPVLNKENRIFSFTCSYRLPEEDNAREFHTVLLGRTHLVYVDLLLYAIDAADPYHSLFQNVVDSLTFQEGFEARDSYVDACIKKVASYELLGITPSNLGRSLVHTVLIIFLLNLALDYVANPRKRRYIRIEFLQRNKKKTRFATIPLGVIVYLVCV